MPPAPPVPPPMPRPPMPRRVNTRGALLENIRAPRNGLPAVPPPPPPILSAVLHAVMAPPSSSIQNTSTGAPPPPSPQFNLPTTPSEATPNLISNMESGTIGSAYDVYGGDDNGGTTRRCILTAENNSKTGFDSTIKWYDYDVENTTAALFIAASD